MLPVSTSSKSLGVSLVTASTPPKLADHFNTHTYEQEAPRNTVERALYCMCPCMPQGSSSKLH